MRLTLALDVYGTLIDPLGIGQQLRDYIGAAAPAFARRWRDKQIEYLYRRALMRDYVDFPTCTRHALEYTDAELGADLSAEAREALLRRYTELPAYADAAPALAALSAADHRLYAFSNGHPDDLDALLAHAGLNDLLDGIVSVHAVRSFKPDPAVYAHFLEQATSTAADTWLVSGNPFDVIGARACGWSAAWVRRDPAAVFDPWEFEPTATITGLDELRSVL